ncbi:MAG TPA: sigma 54-interacting transcriptional regulator [Gemmatimonadaceae bacterium]|nr:sigma 54-interacting transcriptional regulator [Gemmatimonadaceae bacterium]
MDVIARLLLGESKPMQQLRSLVVRLAGSEAAVLIEGPTGSGKELVAEALHLCSARPGAFVPFNVCAIGDGTFESAVFGHARGGFTGAVHDVPGYLAEADRGTVFFDEISSLPLTVQPKLLRALETKSFRPVGARHDRTSHFRLVAASNCDLSALVDQGRFRADLLHRLRALAIRVPSLVEHIEDVPLLAQHFARQLSGGLVSRFDTAASRRLMEHTWPGNVRELRNVVEFALRLAEGEVVGAVEISRALEGRRHVPPRDDLSWLRQQLVTMVADCDGDIARVAERLGMHSSNVYRRMRRLGIDTPKRRYLPLASGTDSQPPRVASS